MINRMREKFTKMQTSAVDKAFSSRNDQSGRPSANNKICAANASSMAILEARTWLTQM